MALLARHDSGSGRARIRFVIRSERNGARDLGFASQLRVANLIIFPGESQEHHSHMGLIVRSSDVHAAGVFTTAPIKRRTKVIEYTGPIISKEEGDRIYEHRDI